MYGRRVFNKINFVNMVVISKIMTENTWNFYTMFKNRYYTGLSQILKYFKKCLR